MSTPGAVWLLLIGLVGRGVPAGEGGTSLSLADASRQGKLPCLRHASCSSSPVGHKQNFQLASANVPYSLGEKGQDEG